MKPGTCDSCRASVAHLHRMSVAGQEDCALVCRDCAECSDPDCDCRFGACSRCGLDEYECASEPCVTFERHAGYEHDEPVTHPRHLIQAAA